MSPKDKSDGFTFASCKELGRESTVGKVARNWSIPNRSISDPKNDLTYDYEIPGLIAYRPRHKFLYSRTQLTY